MIYIGYCITFGRYRGKAKIINKYFCSLSIFDMKVLLTVFFDYNGVVHHEFLPKGRTVNKEYYKEVMQRLREAIRLKRSELWKNIVDSASR